MLLELRVHKTGNELEAARKLYEEKQKAHLEAIIAAMREGVRPAEIDKLTPFTSAYVRRVARRSGIGPFRKGH